MSNIILPEDIESKEKKDQTRSREDFSDEITYEPTKEDELTFLLCYHMKMQPSEAERMDIERRKWFLGRFMLQKHNEKEAFEQMRLMENIGSRIRT